MIFTQCRNNIGSKVRYSDDSVIRYGTIISVDDGCDGFVHVVFENETEETKVRPKHLKVWWE